ncbi:hypothetical protein KY343_04285 [Candidatus Woesearchaeota archaeon]|nr:hypothetical protein [Candidatus Woesearchaeota archaeon]
MNLEDLTPKQKVKEELFQLIRRLERKFNERDEERFEELQSQYLKDSDFFREWMVYDRLVVLSMIKGHERSLKWFNGFQSEYAQLKHASENTSLYINELAAWKKAHKVE